VPLAVILGLVAVTIFPFAYPAIALLGFTPRFPRRIAFSFVIGCWAYGVVVFPLWCVGFIAGDVQDFVVAQCLGAECPRLIWLLRLSDFLEAHIALIAAGVLIGVTILGTRYLRPRWPRIVGALGT
jgi:hypothetical protein